MEDNEA